MKHQLIESVITEIVKKVLIDNHILESSNYKKVVLEKLDEDSILYEKGNYYVIAGLNGGYEIYKNTSTHAIRRAIIGYKGEKGLNFAKRQIDVYLNRDKY